MGLAHDIDEVNLSLSSAHWPLAAAQTEAPLALQFLGELCHIRLGVDAYSSKLKLFSYEVRKPRKEGRKASKPVQIPPVSELAPEKAAKQARPTSKEGQ